MSWFAFPAGLFALLAVPAVFALHLFRSRHRRIPVSALFLWTDPESEATAGRRRMPLRRTPSLWLELLAALVAALFIAGFNPFDRAEGRHLVVVLDDSASMSARNSGGDGPELRVRERLAEAFHQYGRRLRLTLVRSGPRPSLLCGPGALVAEAAEALEQWHPAAPSHDPGPALMLAKELAEGGVIWFMSDMLPPEGVIPAESVRVIALGEADGNLALAEARRVRADGSRVASADPGFDPDAISGRDRVSCTVRSFAAEARTTLLRVTSGGREVASEEISLDAGQSRTFEWQIPSASPALRLEIGDDGLLLDNLAVLHPLPDRTVHIGVGLDEQATSAMRLSELIAALPGVEQTSNLAAADLVLAHERAPAPSWSLVMPQNPDDAAEAEAFVRGFLPEKQHPLLDGITLEGVVWCRNLAFPTPGRPLLTVGDLPLLSMQAAAGAVSWHLNLLPVRSTLSLSPDWPILFSNLIELRRAGLPGPRSVNLVAGQAFHYLARQPGAFELHGPAGTTALEGGELVVEGLAPFPDYRLSQQDQDVVHFAVNFADDAESDLSGAHNGERPPLSGETQPAQQRYAESGFGRLLLLVLLAAVVCDWLVLGGARRP